MMGKNRKNFGFVTNILAVECVFVKKEIADGQASGADVEIFDHLVSSTSHRAAQEVLSLQ